MKSIIPIKLELNGERGKNTLIPAVFQMNDILKEH
jgi:hypothetical protein